MVAQEFLKYFLAEFSSGQSLSVAVRFARERLQGLEAEYPCATWLPVICQNPAEPLMVWEQQQTPADSTRTTATKENLRSPKHPSTKNQHLSRLLLASVIVVALVMGVRYMGMLQPWELKAYDHLMQLRPKDETPDPRLLIVTVDEADIQYQIQQSFELMQLSQ